MLDYVVENYQYFDIQSNINEILNNFKVMILNCDMEIKILVQ